jgi:gamma-glutamyltranspeptidase/glutathione hydrolase
MVAAVRAAGERSGNPDPEALLSLEDLSRYEPLIRPPVVAWFRGSQILGMGPPSSGGIALLQVLSILEGFPLDAERRPSGADTGAGSRADREPWPQPSGITARALHWWIEAMRRAFADRATHLGDPDFHVVPVEELLSPEWIARRRVSIGQRADLMVGPLELQASPAESSETTHISVVDRQGNAVSLTTTLNAAFGSGILVPGAGFLLNDEIDDFSIVAGLPNQFDLVGGEANAIVARKRPLSSMTPIVVREGGQRVSLVLGSPGGPRIITAVTQVLLRVLAYGEDLEAAIRAPRLHQQWRPEVTVFEAGWPAAMLESLRRVHGQPVEVQPEKRFGSVQGIAIDSNGVPTGISDPRRGGTAQVEHQPMSRPAHPSDGLRSTIEDAARSRAQSRPSPRPPKE